MPLNDALLRIAARVCLRTEYKAVGRPGLARTGQGTIQVSPSFPAPVGSQGQERHHTILYPVCTLVRLRPILFFSPQD